MSLFKFWNFSVNKSVTNVSSINILRNISSRSIHKQVKLPKRYQGSTTSVWWLNTKFEFIFLLIFVLFKFLSQRNEYVQLSMKYQPINLGLGFADYPVPQYITDALVATASNPNYLLHQYTRGFVSILWNLLCIVSNDADIFVSYNWFLQTPNKLV